MEPHLEYGTKAAGGRIADALQRLGTPATVSSCGKAAEFSPSLIQDAVKRGHEVACRGWRWEKQAHVEAAAERHAIARTVKVLTEIAGQRPVGWRTRSTPSPNTRRLLVEEGGFLYDSDDYSDDLPFFAKVSGQRHVVLPYSFDTNDMHYHQGFHRFVTARDFAEYTTDAFDTLWAEGERQPKMRSIGLHLRMIGRPGPIAPPHPLVPPMTSTGTPS